MQAIGYGGAGAQLKAGVVVVAGVLAGIPPPLIPPSLILPPPWLCILIDAAYLVFLEMLGVLGIRIEFLGRDGLIGHLCPLLSGPWQLNRLL
jgi:hypothetical protein